MAIAAQFVDIEWAPTSAKCCMIDALLIISASLFFHYHLPHGGKITSGYAVEVDSAGHFLTSLVPAIPVGGP